MLLKEQYQVLIKSLLPYAQKQLGFKKPPIINFEEDEENSKNPLGKTAYYHPEDKEITIFVTNRHPKDILRSVAHELVHYKQDCDGRLTNNLRQDLHDKNYTQNNAELRKFEEEAYLKGNMIFRDWEDNYKNGSKTIIKITKESKEMTESVLRSTIKRLVAEIVKEEKEKKEEQRVDVSKVRDSAKSKELSKYKIAEEVEEDSTLNEWKNQELFGLLSERFGIKEMTDKQKKFAALAPPKDKITYADKIAGAKKAGKMGEDTEKETPEQKRKREKREASAKYKEAEESQYQKPQGKSQGIQEKKMTQAEKKEEEKLGKKMEKAGVQAKFEEQYGKEEGKKRYFATKRARAMENA